MRKGKRVLALGAFLCAFALVVGPSIQPLSAQVTIPQGSTINSAVFSVYSLYNTGQTVSIHRITAGWGEGSVTWANFAGQYDAAVITTFSTDAVGWREISLTSLVQAWVSGVYFNYGIAMIQGMTSPNVYWSSEATNPDLRPKLEVWYTTPSGLPGYAKIQRPGIVQDGVEDADISERYPYFNNGTAPTLITGDANGYEKRSLVRFHFDVIPPSPGTGTPGYWMNHPDAWPEPGITIGGRYYAKETAISLMFMPPAGDMTYVMFAALVAAKLNVMIGNDASCISGTISEADAWMANYPVGSGVRAGGRTSPWRAGEPFYKMLDDYNNGLLCAPSRDTIY